MLRTSEHLWKSPQKRAGVNSSSKTHTYELLRHSRSGYYNAYVHIAISAVFSCLESGLKMASNATKPASVLEEDLMFDPYNTVDSFPVVIAASITSLQFTARLFLIDLQNRVSYQAILLLCLR